MRLVLAELVGRLHLIVVLLTLTGWLFLDGMWLRLYGLCLGIILLQWLLLENRCILTIWEDLLRHGHSHNQKRAENTFIGRIIKQITGRTPSYRVLNAMSYSLLTLAIIATWYRISRGA
jgi:hypothetical protein